MPLYSSSLLRQPGKGHRKQTTTKGRRVVVDTVLHVNISSKHLFTFSQQSIGEARTGNPAISCACCSDDPWKPGRGQIQSKAFDLSDHLKNKTVVGGHVTGHALRYRQVPWSWASTSISTPARFASCSSFAMVGLEGAHGIAHNLDPFCRCEPPARHGIVYCNDGNVDERRMSWHTGGER
jgi:hypothetical protein